MAQRYPFEVIDDIRYLNGADVDEDEDPVLVNMRENLQQALKRLSDDLYSNPTHFLMELIQNADDNTFPSRVQPQLELHFYKPRQSGPLSLRVVCNEVGFTEENVRAICSIGKSTKTKARGFIDSTLIELQLLPEYANRIKADVLAVASKLRRLSFKGEIQKEWRRVDNGNLSVSIFEDGIESRYLTTDLTLNMRSISEEKRKNVVSSMISLAFPVDKNGYPLKSSQETFAFLPLRNYGFHFVIQADFLTTASRESILDDSLWNERLRDNVPTAFVQMIDRFLSSSTTRYTWVRYIDGWIADTFMNEIGEQIKEQLRSKRCLVDKKGRYREPKELLFCPSTYMLGGEPLVPCPGFKEYISGNYSETDAALVKSILVVPNLTFDQFLYMLGHVSFQVQTIDWQETTASILCSQLQKVPQRTIEKILALAMIPLADGTWTSVQSTENLFFSTPDSSIPADLPISELAPVNPYSYRSQLIREHILAIHMSSDIYEKTPSQILEHAKYLFARRHDLGSNLSLSLARDGFLVPNHGGSVVEPHNTYLSSPDIILFEELPPSLWIHDDFDLHGSQWRDWLCNSLGVRTTDNILRDGEIATEWMDIFRSMTTELLLEKLCEHWESFGIQDSSAALEQLSSITVDSSIGPSKLTDTLLPRQSLSKIPSEHVPYLHVSNPESGSWDFLEALGVTVKPSADMYLKALAGLQRSDQSTEELTKSTAFLYRQLDRCLCAPQGPAELQSLRNRIIDAFAESLIFCKGEWYPPDCTSIVWKGPAHMRSAMSISPLHPECSNLFKQTLQIPDAGFPDLIKEIKHVVQDPNLFFATPGEDKYLWSLLQDLAKWLSRSTKYISLTKFLEVPAFLVRDPDGSKRLTACTSKFFSLRPLRSLLTHRDLKGRFTFLEDAVVTSFTSVGDSIPEPEIEGLITTRSEYILRLCDAPATKEKLSGEQHDEIQGIFKQLVVVSVDEIIANHELLEVSHKSRVTSYFSNEMESAPPTLILERAHKDRWASAFAKVLVPLVVGRSNLDIMHLLTADAESCEDQLYAWDAPCREEYLGVITWTDTTEREEVSNGSISSFHPNKHRDPSRVSADLRRETGLVSNSTPAEPQKNTKQLIAQHLAQLTISAEDVVWSSHENYATGSFTTAAFSIPTAMSSSIAAGPSIPPLLSHNVLPNEANIRYHQQPNADIAVASGNTRSSQNSSLLSSTMVGEVTLSQMLVGVTGEDIVYHWLKAFDLPFFSQDNWTSEIRGRVPGFSPFNGRSPADFCYDDIEGKLTSILRPDCCEQYVDAGFWPKYLLEVKSTSSGNETPFVMRKNQFETALRYSDPSNRIEGPPKVLYCIVRVSMIYSGSPQVKLLWDPHRMLFEGRLRIQDSVYVKVLS
ncbi:hypothetical protein DL96DRAFT_1581759 [Flagelloscypha sp. PMI_526]|nr:hypothetical protein DL96DRAFT_1581759 [Flagelloscypha sp. PMI_526]